MFDNETEFEAYSEWAETDLIWGKGMYNWSFKGHRGTVTDDIDVSNHPLCQFGPSKDYRKD